MASLGVQTRIIKLSSLANGKTTASYNEDLLDIDLGQGFHGAAGKVGLGVWRRLGITSARGSQ